MSASSLVTALVYGAGLFVSVAFIIVWIVVLATVVRKNRPDALPVLGASVGVSALATGFSVAVAVAARFVTPSGAEAYMIFYAATSAGSTLLHAAASALLIAGVVKLSKPPPAAPVW
jgi:hypothetical protein